MIILFGVCIVILIIMFLFPHDEKFDEAFEWFFIGD